MITRLSTILLLVHMIMVTVIFQHWQASAYSFSWETGGESRRPPHGKTIFAPLFLSGIALALKLEKWLGLYPKIST